MQNCTECTSKYYNYLHQNVLENKNYNLYCNKTVLADATNQYLEDIIQVYKKIQKKCTYINNITVPNSNDIQDTIYKIILKYSNKEHCHCTNSNNTS